MTQISRPFQIALAALVLLFGVWFFALRTHTSSPSSEPAVTTSTPTASTPHVPVVSGVLKAVEKARGAVTTSKQNAKQLEERSAQVSGGTAPTTSAPAHAAPTTSAPSATTHAPSTHAKPVAPARPISGVPPMQAKVEGELHSGAIVAILFWSKEGADDRAVRAELNLLARVHHRLAPYSKNKLVQRLLKVFGLELDKKIAVHFASARELSAFGTITRGVQVYGTPTMVVLNKNGQATTLTGLVDAFVIEQTIDEARHA